MDFLLLYAGQEYESFREAEFLSLIDLSGVKLELNFLSKHDWSHSFLVVTLQNEVDAEKLIDRSVLIKAAYKIWVSSDRLESLCDKISKLPDDVTRDIVDRDLSLRCDVEVMHKRMSAEDKLVMIEKVLGSHSQLKSKRVSLKDAGVRLTILLDYPYDSKHGRVTADHPKHIYYGPKVGQTQRCDFINKYRLSKRQFIGNTSMEVRLAFIMSNLGRVSRSHLVLDPFVGTGSILVAAAHFGSKVIGADIDYKVVHGLGKSTKANEIWRGKEECLRLNFQQYGLLSNFLEIFIADASRLDKVLRSNLLFDAILTDPPYGIREKSRKLMALDVRPYMYDQQVPHYPQKETYQLSSVFGDLLSFSAKRLRLDGYLVMWLPLIRMKYTGPSCLPCHESMHLVHNCEQILNKNASRRLLVYRKITEPTGDSPYIPLCDDMLNETFRKNYLNL